MVQYFHLTSIFTANLFLSADDLCLALSGILFHLWPAVSSPQLYSIPAVSSLSWFWFGFICCLLSFFQEVFLRRMQLSVTTMELVAKKRCSGWGHWLCLLCFLIYSWLLYYCKEWDLFNATVHYVSPPFCYCLFHSLFSFVLSRSSLFQDVDTIYHSQDNREFNLLDFSHLDSRWRSLLPS